MLRRVTGDSSLTSRAEEGVSRTLLTLLIRLLEEPKVGHREAWHARHARRSRAWCSAESSKRRRLHRPRRELMLSRGCGVHPRLLTSHGHAHRGLTWSSGAVRLTVRPAGLLLRLLTELGLLLTGEHG